MKPHSTALSMMLLTAALAFGQTPAFEAASVKPSVPPVRPATIRFLAGGRLEAHNSTLLAILQQAYGVTDFQIANLPAWAANDRFNDRFDIEATAPAGDTETPRVRLMLQTLLADRFHLHIRHETRPVPVYELVPGKSGIRLKPLAEGGTPAFDFNPTGGYLTGTSVGMTAFIATLQRWLDRPLLDKTGFSLPFNVTLSWAPGPENSRNALPFPPAPNDSRPDIFTAVQEQLGLRLNAARDPLDVIVVDSVEHPTPN